MREKRASWMRKPFSSTCARILPMRRRSTASGLTMNNVRSRATDLLLVSAAVGPQKRPRVGCREGESARTPLGRRLPAYGTGLACDTRLRRRAAPRARAPLRSGLARLGTSLRRRGRPRRAVLAARATALQRVADQARNLGRNARHGNARGFERRHLLGGRAAAARDDRAGVPHALAGRRGLAGDERHDRLLHVLADELGGLFLVAAADLAHEHDGFGLRIR